MLGAVTDLDVALITGGFTVAAVVVTFGGNALLDMARSRRAARESRDAAIAEVLAASMDLALAVSAIRAAHQHRTRGMAPPGTRRRSADLPPAAPSPCGKAAPSALAVRSGTGL